MCDPVTEHGVRSLSPVLEADALPLGHHGGLCADNKDR